MTVTPISPNREKPRERLYRLGAAALSDAELLALLLGTGIASQPALQTAQRILTENGSIERLSEYGISGLARIRGIGTAKATRLLAAFELGIRLVEMRKSPMPPITVHTSEDVFNAYHTRLAPLRQEIFFVVGLNAKNQVIREITVAMGSIDECHVAPREVFRPLLLEAACRAILVHNHPSGDPAPSTQDLSLTRRLIKVGDLLGIPILDHVIIGRFSHVSLRDLGLVLEFESAG